MLASELVEEIKKNIKEHGDMEIKLDSYSPELTPIIGIDYHKGGTYAPVEPCLIIV